MNKLPLALAALFFTSLTAHASPLVLSGLLTNVNGDDSPYEYAQLVATQDIDFAATPFTIVWNDVGAAGSTGTASFSDGWAGGSLLSYAFQLNTGMVTRGETFYIGGSAQLIAGPGSTSLAGLRWLRTINTTTTGGDGLGTADSTGVLGNGGPNADGIGVFQGLVNAITSLTVPLDTIFFGNAVGTAKPVTGGFKAAQNDRYTSAGVFGDAGNAFLFSDLAQNEFLRFAGTFNWATQQWQTPRTGAVVALTAGSQVAEIASQVVLVPEPSAVMLMLGGALALSTRRQRRRA